MRRAGSAAFAGGLAEFESGVSDFSTGVSGIAAGTNGILFDEFHNLGETGAQHRVYSVEEMRELLMNFDN